MSLDFPANPVVGQVYNGYVRTGVAWESGYSPVVPNLQLATYANAAARDAAITSPTTGMQAYLLDIKQVTTYNGSVWKSDMAGLVPVVPPTVAVSGGTATANSFGEIAFTAATSLSLNGVFTGLYKNYKILISLSSAASGTNALLMRVRTAGVDKTGTTYAYAGTENIFGTAIGGIGSNNATSHPIIGGVPSTGGGNIVVEIFEPFTNMRTSYQSQSWGYSTNWNSRFNAGQYQANESHDGITFFASSGNITGTVQILGYNS